MDPTPAGNLVTLLMAIFSLLNSGAELHKAGKFAEAVDAYAKVVVMQEQAHVPTGPTYYMRAEAEMALKRFPAARASYFASIYHGAETEHDFIENALMRFDKAGGNVDFAPLPESPYRMAQRMVEGLRKKDYEDAYGALSAKLRDEYPIPYNNGLAATWKALECDLTGYRVHVEFLAKDGDQEITRLCYVKYKDAGDEVPVLTTPVLLIDMAEGDRGWRVVHMALTEPEPFWRELEGQEDSAKVHFNAVSEPKKPDPPKVAVNEDQAILVEQQNMQLLVGALRQGNMQMGGLYINNGGQQDAPAEAARPLWKHPVTGETLAYVYRPGVTAGSQIADGDEKLLLAAAPLVVDGQRDVLYTDSSTARLPEATFQKLREFLKWEAPELLPSTSVPPELRAKIEALITDLGADDPQVRQDSRAALMELDAQARPQLLAHRNHADPEIRLTIRDLLQRTEPKSDATPEGQQQNQNGQPMFIKGQPMFRR